MTDGRSFLSSLTASLSRSSAPDQQTQSGFGSGLGRKSNISQISNSSINRNNDDLDAQLVSYAADLWKPEWANDNDLCGEMSKQGKATYYKKWQKRWLVLKNDSLFYFKSREDTVPLGVLFLDSSTIVEDASRLLSAPFVISVTVNSSCSLDSSRAFQRRAYLFMADTRLDFDTWLDSIRNAAIGVPITDYTSIQNQLSISQPLPAADLFFNRHINAARNTSIRSISFDSLSTSVYPPPLSHSTLFSNDNISNGNRSSGRHHASSLLSLNSPLTRGQSISNAFLENDDLPFTLSDIQQTASPLRKPRSPSISLYNIFVDVYQHIRDYSDMVKSNLSNPRDAPPVNYLEPGTSVIRNVRHLLYYVDGKFAKSMNNTDFSACLGRHMSVVIDRSRKIGYHAKHLTEEECIGLRSPALVRELIVQLEDLISELQIFVMIAKNLTFIDSTAYQKDQIFTQLASLPIAKNGLQELLNACFEMARAVNTQDKEHYSHISSNLTGLSRLFCSAFKSHCTALSGFYSNIAAQSIEANKMLLTVSEMLDFQQVAEKIRIELKDSTEQASDLWPPPNADILMTEKFFTLAVQLIRLILTLLTISKDSNFDEVSNFWITFQFSQSSQQESRSYSQYPSRPFMKWILNTKGATDPQQLPDLPPSPIDRILEEDVDNAFGETDQLVKELLAAREESKSDGSKEMPELTEQLTSSLSFSQSGITHNTPNNVSPQMMNSRPSPRYIPASATPPPCLPTKQEDSNQELFINQIVSSTIRDLVVIILDTSKSLAELLIMESKRLATNSVLERIGQLSTAIVTACSQTEEELGALEAHNIPPALSNALDDAQQALSRSCSCFEISIKELTGFFAPPEASKNVLKDIVALEKACKLMTSTVNELVSYQAKMESKLQKKVSGSNLLLKTEIEGESPAPPSPPMTPLEPKIQDFKKMVDEKVVEDILEQEKIAFETGEDIVFKHFEDGRTPLVRAGTLQKLVEKLTYHKLPSTEFTSAFLLTYRSFTTADQLLSLLKERYNTQISDSTNLMESQRKIYMTKKIVPIRLRVLNVLKMWVKNNYEDFASSPELLESLYAFLPTMREDFKNALKDFETLLDRQAKGTQVGATATASSERPPVPMIPKATTLLSLLDIDPVEIARQLTLLQWKTFYAIKPNECLDQAWNDKKLHHRSPHIRQMIQFSNFIVQLVGTEIVQGMMPKNRAMFIKHWIIVAEKLKALNNFDGLKSVLCGLHASAITRMKKTWECVPTKSKVVLDELSQLMSEEKSCKNYRQMLHSINPPCIPFLGVYLTDLTMIETGNSDNLKESPNLINFQKRYLVAQVINELRRYQCTPYNLTVVDSISCWIKERPVQDPQEIYDTSLALEPRVPMVLQQSSSLSNGDEDPSITSVGNETEQSFASRRKSLNTIMRQSSLSTLLR